MKIPKSFKLFGSTITVEFNNDLCDKEEAYGTSRFKQNNICLSNKSLGEPIETSELEVVFLHELLHFVLFRLEYHKLSRDEDFVRKMARTLHQCLTTQKY